MLHLEHASRGVNIERGPTDNVFGGEWAIANNQDCHLDIYASVQRRSHVNLKTIQFTLFALEEANAWL